MFSKVSRAFFTSLHFPTALSSPQKLFPLLCRCLLLQDSKNRKLNAMQHYLPVFLEIEESQLIASPLSLTIKPLNHLISTEETCLKQFDLCSTRMEGRLMTTLVKHQGCRSPAGTRKTFYVVAFYWFQFHRCVVTDNAEFLAPTLGQGTA